VIVELNLKRHTPKGLAQSSAWQKFLHYSQSTILTAPVSEDVGLRLELLHQIGFLQQTILPVLEEEANLFDLLLVVMLVSEC
jgi:hypothetical protein